MKEVVEREGWAQRQHKEAKGHLSRAEEFGFDSESNEKPFSKAEAVVQTWTAHFGSLDFGKFTAILKIGEQPTGEEGKRESQLRVCRISIAEKHGRPD